MVERLVRRGDLRGRIFKCHPQLRRQRRRALRVVISVRNTRQQLGGHAQGRYWLGPRASRTPFVRQKIRATSNEKSSLMGSVPSAIANKDRIRFLGDGIQRSRNPASTSAPRLRSLSSSKTQRA